MTGAHNNAANYIELFGTPTLNYPTTTQKIPVKRGLTRDGLGDGMFDLQSRVHFQEVEVPIAIDEKLASAGRIVAYR